jgi:hypothetical protein
MIEVKTAEETLRRIKELNGEAKQDEPRIDEPNDHNTASGDSPGIMSATELLGRQYPEPKWAINGLLSEGATVLAGAPKAGKSWCSLGFALAVAKGENALGSIPVTPGDVLYLGLEDGERRMQKRVRHVLNGENVPQNLQFAFQWTRLNEGGIDKLEAWLKAHTNARLVVIDTLKRVRPQERRGGRIYDGDYDAVGPLNDLAQKYGVCILIIHHTNKLSGNEDWFDSISGSLGLSAAVDNLMLLNRTRNQRIGTLCAAGRDIEDKELEVEFDKDKFTWKLLGNAPDPLSRKILTWLLKAGDAGLNKTDINKQNGGRSEGVEDALAELEELGKAKDLLKGKSGRSQQWVAIVGE